MRSPQTLLRYYSGRKMRAVGSRLPMQSNTNPLPGGSTIPGWLTTPLPACSRHPLSSLLIGSQRFHFTKRIREGSSKVSRGCGTRGTMTMGYVATSGLSPH